jgi:DNA-binding beta-propeller fold protein YncE
MLILLGKVGAFALLGLALACLTAGAAEQPPLKLEAKIPLGKVNGRIDHLAVDLDRRRLFVAELGNNTVGVIDLKDRKLVTRIGGLKQPQGVGYEPSTDTLYVANAGDGAVLLFQGTDFAPVGRIELGEDADNIRVDSKANKVFIGYGSGAVAVIDPASRAKVANFRLAAHPEGFQLESSGGRIFVNVPQAQEIAVIDRSGAKVSASWTLTDIGANFPMAIDDAAQRILIVARRPAKLVAFRFGNGSIDAKIDSCHDADDVFVDAKRGRVYVSCGEGFIDVFERRDGRYDRIAQVPTVQGARTSFFSAALDTLFLAARATADQPAAIWIFQPAPK